MRCKRRSRKLHRHGRLGAPRHGREGTGMAGVALQVAERLGGFRQAWRGIVGCGRVRLVQARQVRQGRAGRGAS